jgi:hypothetical protein
VEELHAIPVCRRPESRELDLAVRLAQKAAASSWFAPGTTERTLPYGRLRREMYDIPRVRHEKDSDVGKQHVMAAVTAALEKSRPAPRD